MIIQNQLILRHLIEFEHLLSSHSRIFLNEEVRKMTGILCSGRCNNMLIISLFGSLKCIIIDVMIYARNVYYHDLYGLYLIHHLPQILSHILEHLLEYICISLVNLLIILFVPFIFNLYDFFIYYLIFLYLNL